MALKPGKVYRFGNWLFLALGPSEVYPRYERYLSLLTDPNIKAPAGTVSEMYVTSHVATSAVEVA